ncbi:diaminopimelate epimerase [Chryseolinea sp. H1M3-3]|uniref:diaminopimelate epimerase n=1 Tax=Chryseolinea sp. H1M3-3 TaxID=3034144 RepID=UPI0023EB1153|nr:diaminopimelate epimerase [Chryseolinea sp. H1M3-3]
MSTIHFHKYQATGNDFVIIDNRKTNLTFTKDQIAKICHPKFGIGADGLMLIENHPSLNFHLQYYNSDGSQSLCGNGCRAAVQFASQLGLVNGKATFDAFDGAHAAEILPSGDIRLKMGDVKEVKKLGEDFYANTGSPHYIRLVNNVQTYPVFEEGRKIRYADQFKPGGTNVNFVELQPNNSIFVRTYERGVENETLSCGTGITAAALVTSLKGYSSPVKIHSLGGDLAVEFKTSQSGTFYDIYLIGPAKMVFKGQLEL